jgi:hypothetical protein
MPELANQAAAQSEIKLGRCKHWSGIEPELGFIRFSLPGVLGRNVPACDVSGGKSSGMRHASGLHVMQHVIVILNGATTPVPVGNSVLLPIHDCQLI